MNDASSLISPIDVAVCDPDVLWRVEHMNAIKGVNVREFASAADAIEAATEGHWMVVVIGPTSPRDELAAVAGDPSGASIRLVVVDRNDGEDLGAPGEPVVDRVLGFHVDDEAFAAAVLEQLARQDEPSRDVEPAVQSGADESDDAPAAPATEPRNGPDGDTEPSAGTGAEPDTAAGAESGLDRRAGNVIVVTSAKGGEGASTIALNLAIEIADPRVRVALIDGDPHFGDLALDLGLTPAVAHVDRHGATPEEDPVALLSEDPSGVLLVQLQPPPTDPGADPTEHDRQALAEVIDLTRGQADVVVVDMPFDALVDSERFHDLGPILVVTTGHTASVKNALLVAERLGTTRGAGLVVNEISRHHSTVPADEIARSVGLPLRAHLPYDPTLVRAATTPEARLVAGRHSKFGRAVRTLRHDLATGELVTTR